MAYNHGVYTSEAPTSIIPAVNSMAGLPVIFGTAPVHLATDRAPVNKPILCYSYAEAVAAVGFSKDWKSILYVKQFTVSLPFIILLLSSW